MSARDRIREAARRVSHKQQHAEDRARRLSEGGTFTPRLKDVKNAWCRERAPIYEGLVADGYGYGDGLDPWTVAVREFERLIEQIRADAYARGKRAGENGEHITPHGSASYQDGPIPPGTMTSRELADTEDD